MANIKVEHLRKQFGATAAVDDVSLSITSGQFVTLLGPSGSGKTTTMRMIAGLERPDGGIITIGDRVVTGPGVFLPTYKRKLGMVFQSYAVWPHMTVRENVLFPLRHRGVPERERGPMIERMLDLVGLLELKDRYPWQLSGGQQQRVALARALVAEPVVILFDEPLSNLDARLRESMRVLLRDLHDRLHTTALYVTHDQDEAMSLSDQIYILDKGRLVQGGTPKQLYEHPATRFVAEFIGNANVLQVIELDRAAGRARLAGGQVLRAATVRDGAVENVLVARPSRLAFAERDDSDNVIDGTVRSVTFLGDRVRYRIQAPGEIEVNLELQTGHPGREVGEAVRVRLPPEACSLL